MKNGFLVAAPILLGAALVIGLDAGDTSGTARAAEPMSFKEDVFPIFVGRCIQCHQPGVEDFETHGLDLSTYEGTMKGNKLGPMVIPGDPDTSNLIWLLDWKASPELRMPHGKKRLSRCDRDAIRAWIKQGAKDN